MMPWIDPVKALQACEWDLQDARKTGNTTREAVALAHIDRLRSEIEKRAGK